MTPTATQNLARRLHSANYDWPRELDKARLFGVTISDLMNATAAIGISFSGQPKQRANANAKARAIAQRSLG